MQDKILVDTVERTCITIMAKKRLACSKKSLDYYLKGCKLYDESEDKEQLNPRFSPENRDEIIGFYNKAIAEVQQILESNKKYLNFEESAVIEKFITTVTDSVETDAKINYYYDLHPVEENLRDSID